jgi:hypothetical protein
MVGERGPDQTPARLTCLLLSVAAMLGAPAMAAERSPATPPATAAAVRPTCPAEWRCPSDGLIRSAGTALKIGMAIMDPYMGHGEAGWLSGARLSASLEEGGTWVISDVPGRGSAARPSRYLELARDGRIKAAPFESNGDFLPVVADPITAQRIGAVILQDYVGAKVLTATTRDRPLIAEWKPELDAWLVRARPWKFRADPGGPAVEVAENGAIKALYRQPPSAARPVSTAPPVAPSKRAYAGWPDDTGWPACDDDAFICPPHGVIRDAGTAARVATAVLRAHLGPELADLLKGQRLAAVWDEDAWVIYASPAQAGAAQAGTGAASAGRLALGRLMELAPQGRVEAVFLPHDDRAWVADADAALEIGKAVLEAYIGEAEVARSSRGRPLSARLMYGTWIVTSFRRPEGVPPPPGVIESHKGEPVVQIEKDGRISSIHFSVD